MIEKTYLTFLYTERNGKSIHKATLIQYDNSLKPDTAIRSEGGLYIS